MPRPTASSLVLHRGLVLGLSIGLATPLAARPRLVSAAPTPATDASVDPDLERSRSLYEEGLARFDTFDYEGAVELWTKAYAELPTDADQIRNQIVYNIATAQQMAFEVDEDLSHLRQAVLLLQQYIRSYKALHERTDQTQQEVDRAEDRIAQLRERIERAEHGQDEPTPTPAQESTSTDARYGSGEIDGIVWTTPSATPLDTDRLHRNRRLATEDRKTDNLMIGSYVALGLGGAATLAGMGAVLGTREAGVGARGAGYGTLGLGVLGLATGVTLLAIGLERRKRARQGTLVAGAPIVAPGMAGAAVAVRF